MNEYTNIIEGVWQCNDCGAHANSKENVVHHDSCVPGESKRWEEYENSNEIKIKANGMEAIILQHEIDHLDGVLFIDKVGDSPRKRSYIEAHSAQYFPLPVLGFSRITV